MRTLIAAALVAAYSLPALAEGCDTQNCTEAYRRPLEARELCFAQNSALRGVIELQSLEIVRLRAELEKAARPVAKKRPERSRTALPCKKGRTRNSAGVCGRWN